MASHYFKNKTKSKKKLLNFNKQRIRRVIHFIFWGKGDIIYNRIFYPVLA